MGQCGGGWGWPGRVKCDTVNLCPCHHRWPPVSKSGLRFRVSLCGISGYGFGFGSASVVISVYGFGFGSASKSPVMLFGSGRLPDPATPTPRTHITPHPHFGPHPHITHHSHITPHPYIILHPQNWGRMTGQWISLVSGYHWAVDSTG